MILDKFQPERESLMIPDPDGDYVRLADVGELSDENCKLLIRVAELESSLKNMVALWERVHGGAILGRPTLSEAKKALRAHKKEGG